MQQVKSYNMINLILKNKKCKHLHIDKLIIQWYYDKNKCDVTFYLNQIHLRLFSLPLLVKKWDIPDK